MLMTVYLPFWNCLKLIRGSCTSTSMFIMVMECSKLFISLIEWWLVHSTNSKITSLELDILMILALARVLTMQSIFHWTRAWTMNHSSLFLCPWLPKLWKISILKLCYSKVEQIVCQGIGWDVSISLLKVMDLRHSLSKLSIDPLCSLEEEDTLLEIFQELGLMRLQSWLESKSQMKSLITSSVFISLLRIVCICQSLTCRIRTVRTICRRQLSRLLKICRI